MFGLTDLQSPSHGLWLSMRLSKPSALIQAAASATHLKRGRPRIADGDMHHGCWEGAAHTRDLAARLVDIKHLHRMVHCGIACSTSRPDTKDHLSYQMSNKCWVWSTGVMLQSSPT